MMSDEKAGPTGKFLRGKAIEKDEDKLSISFKLGIGKNNQAIIIMDFGVPASWIGLEPDMIDNLCETLQRAKGQALELQIKHGLKS